MAGTRLGAFSYQTLAIAFSCVLLSLFPPIRQSGERLPTEGHIVVSQMHFSRVIKELKLHCPGPMRRRRRLQPRGSGRRHPWQQFQAHYPKSSERKVSRERQLSCKRIHAGMTLEFRGFERERKSSGLSQILYKKMYIIIKKMHLIVNRVFFFLQSVKFIISVLYPLKNCIPCSKCHTASSQDLRCILPSEAQKTKVKLGCSDKALRRSVYLVR